MTCIERPAKDGGSFFYSVTIFFLQGVEFDRQDA
jgi:hypothetical protein